MYPSLTVFPANTIPVKRAPMAHIPRGSPPSSLLTISLTDRARLAVPWTTMSGSPTE